MKSSFNKRVLDIDAHVGRSAFTERTRLSRNLGFAAAALVLLIGLIVFRSADVPPSVPVASMRDPARTERSVDHILLKGNGVFVEQPVVRLADTANESDSRVVSTIYTDNPDIVIAWIGD